MTPSDRHLEFVRRDAEFVLYRVCDPSAAEPRLAKAAASESPGSTAAKRLAHEHALRGELDPRWAAQPLEFVRWDGRPMLLLSDPGGEPLDGLVGRPMELTRFLRIGSALSAALAQLHGRGIVHKDIKPANVLVEPESGDVHLMGFGIATRQPRERHALASPEDVAGTLAYMAPEQTGRMNRSIDSRSDLYALGVTLYQMLTGVLPFDASDPIELFHCHLAREAVPPSARVSGIPEMLSAIVMKLLAKAAEDRYQTAAGLEADLRRCLVQWETRGRIDALALAAHDASEQLLIPEKLYGREAEIDVLIDAFERVAAEGAPELVLVSGYAGIGKSSVVNELHRVLVPRRGLFAAGKFDAHRRDIPYATLAQALRTLVRQILGQSEAQVSEWRDVLLAALATSAHLIVKLIPELEFIIGQQPPVQDAQQVSPQDAQQRFQMVFRRFLSAFAQPEHPLVLFLDDLQWLDSATLELLEHLIGEPDLHHLLLIGAYRDNEVDAVHPLMRTFDAIRRAGKVPGHEIALAPLGMADVERLLRDPALRAGARPRPGRAGARTDRRQPLLHEPIRFRAGRRAPARLRTGCIGLELGHRRDPRQGLHRQRRRSDGRQTEPPAARHAGGHEAPRLPRQQRGSRTSEHAARGLGGGYPRRAVGGGPQRPGVPRRRHLRVSARPHSRGRLFTALGRRTGGRTPADWAPARVADGAGRDRDGDLRD